MIPKNPTSVRKKGRRGPAAWIRFAAHQRASPEQIALGFSIGTLIAFTPTMGVQIPLVLLAATLCKANRVSALLPIWATNVITVPAVYGFTYRIGHFFLPGRSPQKVRRLLETLRDQRAEVGLFDVSSHVRIAARLGADLFIPMIIGGFLVGLLAALVAYPIIRGLIRRYRYRRSARLQVRADKSRLQTPISGAGLPGPRKTDAQ